MVSASVVAAHCDELVATAPVGPLQGSINGGNSRQCQADQQSSDFRNSDGNQIRVPFFEGGDAARARITDNAA